MLQIQNLSKVYKGGKRAVDNISLRVAPGEICGFIGHNGAGKTTAIKCVTGIHNPTEGDVLIGGRSILRDPIYCKSIMAYIPDNPDLYDNMTGVKYLNFIADIYRVDKAERVRLIAEHAEKLALTQALGDVISSYSHGMKQKLALISALIRSPKLMVLDEPFVGLDPKAAFVLKATMREMCDNGAAIFFSTHVLEVAEKLCDKVAIIKAGKLITMGRTEDVVGDASLESVFMEQAD